MGASASIVHKDICDSRYYTQNELETMFEGDFDEKVFKALKVEKDEDDSSSEDEEEGVLGSLIVRLIQTNI